MTALRARLAAAEQELTDLRAKLIELDAAWREWQENSVTWAEAGGTPEQRRELLAARAYLTAVRRVAGLTP